MSIQRAAYFSITTPQGTGGIGIIELFGKDALEITGKIFRRATKNPPLPPFVPTNPDGFSGREPGTGKGGNKGEFINKIKPDRIYLGSIYDGTQLIDEVIIHFTPARDSLTGLDTVEINAHGGIMPCRLIGHLLRKFGAKELSQPEVINLARKQGKMDKIQAEALEYLLQAQTPLATSVLLDQYNGALSKALKSRKNYPKLKASARYGIALTQPKRILILGRPNVGKSTLFNALLGQDRAITHHLPGTTRDTIEDSFTIDGFPFVLVDTAGLRKSTNDAIEKIGMAYARKEIPKADVILLVVEKEKTISPQRHKGTKKKTYLFTDIFELRNKTQAPVIIVANKADTLKIQDARCPSAPLSEGVRMTLRSPSDRVNRIQDNIIPISALKRIGLERLRKEILKASGLDNFRYKPSHALIFTKKQMALIH